MASASPKTWLVVGASRGIGHEFVRQSLDRGDRVFATVRNGKKLDSRCTVLECDVLSEKSIGACIEELSKVTDRIDYTVINAGVLKFPNRATEMSYDDFSFHLHTNTIGPIVYASRLLSASLSVGTITFISSDSGSAGNFLAQEDGFAAYSASKAALNQAARHMAAEVKRKGTSTVILLLHPGEVKTDMANIEVDWPVEGQMTPEESVSACIKTIESKGPSDNGTFWTWKNEPYPW